MKLVGDDYLMVMSGGEALSSHIGSGAGVEIAAGGIAKGDLGEAGGNELIDEGAVADGVRVLSGGDLYLSGTAQNSVVSSGPARARVFGQRRGDRE